MSRLARPLIAAGLLLATLPLAVAVAAPQWPAPIRNLEGKGLTIVEAFDAPGGMTGYAARAGNRPLTLYLTPDREHVIIGPMLDADGKNLSQEVLDATITQPDIQSAWPKLEKSNWVADGDDDAKRVIYVFSDPNCPYCHKFYEVARPWVESGKVQLRHIPVGIIKPSSPGKAAAILGAAVINHFSGTIEQMVALAVLMPIVASMGTGNGSSPMQAESRVKTRPATTTRTFRYFSLPHQ